MTEMIAMPAVMTEEMRNDWRSAFISGLHNRRGRGVVGDARKLKHPSAEEAAWKMMVKKYGRPIEDDGGSSLSAGRLGSLFLGRARALRVTTSYDGRPEDLEEKMRLEVEVADLRTEREGLDRMVCFNEVTFEGKKARMTEIDRLLYAYQTKIDLLDHPVL